MIPLKTIEELINKHRLLENDLSSGNIDKKLFAEKSKEYSDLNEIIKDAKKYISYENDKLELQKILDDKGVDKELIKMAEIELNNLVLHKLPCVVSVLCMEKRNYEQFMILHVPLRH